MHPTNVQSHCRTDYFDVTNPSGNLQFAGLRVYYGGAKKQAIMRSRSKFVFLLAMLLASVLFGAQLHCCLDLTSQSIDSHVCPICSVAGAAIVTSSVTMEMVPAIDRLVDFFVPAIASAEVPRDIAPRAPPRS